MKKAAIILACGAVCVAIGFINIWLGILSLPIMFELSKSLTE